MEIKSDFAQSFIKFQAPEGRNGVENGKFSADRKFLCQSEIKPMHDKIDCL